MAVILKGSVGVGQSRLQKFQADAIRYFHRRYPCMWWLCQAKNRRGGTSTAQKVQSSSTQAILQNNHSNSDLKNYSQTTAGKIYA